jgi:hypothetical protein
VRTSTIGTSHAIGRVLYSCPQLSRSRIPTGSYQVVSARMVYIDVWH